MLRYSNRSIMSDTDLYRRVGSEVREQRRRDGEEGDCVQRQLHQPEPGWRRVRGSPAHVT